MVMPLSCLIGIWVLRKGFTGRCAHLVDGGAGHPVLASHRAFPADLAGHGASQFLGKAGTVQRFAAGDSPRGTPSLLQLGGVHSHGHRHVLSHVPVRSRGEDDGVLLRMGPQAFNASCLIRKGQSTGSRKIAFASQWSGWLVRPLHGKCRGFLLCACAATLLATACSRPADSSRTITIEHEISPEPARIGPAVVTFRLIDAAGQPDRGSAGCGRGGHVTRGHVSRF